MALVLQKRKYCEHNWMICGDLQVIPVFILLGQQRGFTKYPCFLCLWGSRARQEHWTRKNWPTRNEFTIGEKIILHKPLVNLQHVLLLPLHIKLEMMKQFVKALNKESDCFKHLCGVFQALSTEKLRAEIFNGSLIRLLINNKRFALSMTAVEKMLGFLFQLLLRIF